MSEGANSVDRAGLHGILGYGGFATCIVNRLIRHGIRTPSDLREATYSDLLDLPGIGQESLDHITASLEYVDRTRKEES